MSDGARLPSEAASTGRPLPKGERGFQCPEIVGVNREVPLLDGRRVRQIFMDNAASTKPFREVSDFIQEIQRYKDQPSAVAEELIDQAAFGDHPLGRTVLGPEDHLRTFSRDAIVAFRERRWAGERRGLDPWPNIP